MQAPAIVRGVARISKKGGGGGGHFYRPFTSDRVQSLASETTQNGITALQACMHACLYVYMNVHFLFPNKIKMYVYCPDSR